MEWRLCESVGHGENLFGENENIFQTTSDLKRWISFCFFFSDCVWNGGYLKSSVKGENLAGENENVFKTKTKPT
jgi:hypothetical protein